MDGTIIESTKELERATYATYALRTYYNYIQAWVVCLERLYGSADDGENAFLEKFKSIVAFKHVQGGGLVSEELCNAYGRGRLILKAMEELPVEQHPELTLSANFWLPVQSYYAIHGVGLATMIALGRGSPRSHSSFRADFSELVNKYFPTPFCGRCIGGPEQKGFSFHGISTSVDKVTRQSQLANPAFVEEIDNFVGKSLSTTRERFLKFRFEDKRREKRKKRLTYEERNECCQKEHATSICDLLYRMRVRSNYDNPDMYLFASSDLEGTTKHYKDLRYLTKMVLTGLDALIERRIGKTEMGQLRSKY